MPSNLIIIMNFRQNKYISIIIIFSLLIVRLQKLFLLLCIHFRVSFINWSIWLTVYVWNSKLSQYYQNRRALRTINMLIKYYILVFEWISTVCPVPLYKYIHFIYYKFPCFYRNYTFLILSNSNGFRYVAVLMRRLQYSLKYIVCCNIAHAHLYPFQMPSR